MKTNLKYVIIALAVVMAAWLLGRAYTYKYRSQDTIVVTGLGETEFSSDKIVWSAAITAEAPSAAAGYLKIEESKAKVMLQKLFEYYFTHPEALPEDFHPQLSFDGMERTVCDYIAGMTDHYATSVFTNIYIPKAWTV